MLFSKMGTGKGGDRSNVDPLSAVIRGNDAAVPQEPKGGSDRVRVIGSPGARSAPLVLSYFLLKQPLYCLFAEVS